MRASHPPFKASSTRNALALVLLAASGSWSCGGSPVTPSSIAQLTQLPFVSETASMRYFHEAGDAVEVPRQEAFNAWALGRLGVVLPQKVEYRKYPSRAAMARYTGHGNTNAFAEPERFTIHSIWPYDNHEVVHVYTAAIGRPSDFFNEGIAVSFQTDPGTGNFGVTFNGAPVHEACAEYRRAGALPLPLGRNVGTNEFPALPDTVMAYRVAGSFVLFLQERFGLAPLLSSRGSREAVRSSLRGTGRLPRPGPPNVDKSAIISLAESAVANGTSACP